MTNQTDLERQIRAALQDNVRDITKGSLTGSNDWLARRPPVGGQRHWLAAGLAAAAVLMLVGVLGGLNLLSNNGGNGDTDAPMGASSGGRITGTWVLIKATEGGTNLIVPVKSPIRLFFADDTIVVDDGVNSVTLAAMQDPKGKLAARFVSTTYVLDPRSGNPSGQALLRLIDSIAPNVDSKKVTTSDFTLDGTQLTIATPDGQLAFRRLGSSAAGVDDGRKGPSSTPARASEPKK